MEIKCSACRIRRYLHRVNQDIITKIRDFRVVAVVIKYIDKVFAG